MRPRQALVPWLAGWTGLGLAAHWLPSAVLVWQLAGLLIASFSLADWWALHRQPTPRLVERLVGGRLGRLALHDWGDVELTLANPSARSLRLWLHDAHPSRFAVRGLPCAILLGPGETTHVRYQLRPGQRGDFCIAGSRIALHSPLRLWVDHRFIPLATRVQVGPNRRVLSRALLNGARARAGERGPHPQLDRRAGMDFQQLRDFRQGDNLRRIDWKASARMRKLIAREYRDERDQQLVFMLDAGRRMRHGDAGHTHLDEALNALLAVADLALAQGDAVGAMTFGGPQRWQAPRRGTRTLGRLIDALYDLQPSLEPADPLEAARTLWPRLPRRTWVIIMTNTRNEDQSELEQAARLLRRRHLLVIADLREAVLDRTLAQGMTDLPSALRYHAAQDWLEQRRAHGARLRQLGVETLDLVPTGLPQALIERYRALKHAGMR
ncbi:DUF58 domain-containing protein [Thiocapsa imhoffii]|uniref:DUF58 domain-containing protein n=1 Tax=Thiocapsa imhoffii TaxID=382777 RepID=A0A9X1BA43_9GAMM|nr:DUF58 domain-containing protein [Thiocapsa imhoffii]MBK1646624.1 DUF58 domain-containing protein [Thiocapsa imhoffii]